MATQKINLSDYPRKGAVAYKPSINSTDLEWLGEKVLDYVEENWDDIFSFSAIVPRKEDALLVSITAMADTEAFNLIREVSVEHNWNRTYGLYHCERIQAYEKQIIMKFKLDCEWKTSKKLFDIMAKDFNSNETETSAKNITSLYPTKFAPKKVTLDTSDILVDVDITSCVLNPSDRPIIAGYSNTYKQIWSDVDASYRLYRNDRDRFILQITKSDGKCSSRRILPILVRTTDSGIVSEVTINLDVSNLVE